MHPTLGGTFMTADILRNLTALGPWLDADCPNELTQRIAALSPHFLYNEQTGYFPTMTTIKMVFKIDIFTTWLETP